MPLEPIHQKGYAQPDRAEVERQVASAVESNPDFFIQQYIRDSRSFGGRYIAADLFKETFEQYRQSKDARNRYNTPVHNSAAVLSAEQFRRMLVDRSQANKTEVIFLTGIPGAGKTSSVLSGGGELPHSYRLIFEGQLSNIETTLQKLHQVLEVGLKPLIMVVHAKPEDALWNTIKRFYEEGRGASINVMSSIQGGLHSTLSLVRDQLGHKVQFVVQDNRNRQDPQTLSGWNHLLILQSEGTHDQIKQRLTTALLQWRADGVVTDSCYQQAIGGIPIGRNESLADNNQQKHETDVRGRGVPPGDREELVLDGSNVSDESEICERCKKNPCKCGGRGQSSVSRPRVRP